jgi:hypothetical protein
MTPFQYLTLPLLSGLFLRELVGLWQGRPGRGSRGLRALVWLLASVAIAWPDLTHRVAHLLGIQRGADLVLYLFALAFLGVTFYFYSRLVRLQRQLTQLVRSLALQEPQRGGPTSSADTSATTLPS